MVFRSYRRWFSCVSSRPHPQKTQKRIISPTFYLSFCSRLFFSNSGPEEFALNGRNKDLIAENQDTCCLPLCKHYKCLGPCDFLEAASRKRTHRKILQWGMRAYFFCRGPFCRCRVRFRVCSTCKRGVFGRGFFWVWHGSWVLGWILARCIVIQFACD